MRTIAETVVFDRVAFAVLLSWGFCPVVAPVAELGGPELVDKDHQRNPLARRTKGLECADHCLHHLDPWTHRPERPVAVADDQAPGLLFHDV